MAKTAEGSVGRVTKLGKRKKLGMQSVRGKGEEAPKPGDKKNYAGTLARAQKV